MQPRRNPFHRISPLVNIQQVFWLSDRPSDYALPVEWTPPVATDYEDRLEARGITLTVHLIHTITDYGDSAFNSRRV